MCNWSRVVSGGWYSWFGFGSGCGGWLLLLQSGIRVRVRVRVRFSNVFDNSRQAFMNQFRVAWPARKHIGIVNSEIDIELQWIYYLFIHVVLWWSARCLGTTGVICSHIGQEGCLDETCRHATVVQTCFRWNRLLVTSIWKRIVGRWIEVVIGCEVVKKGDLWWRKGFS